MPSAAKHDYGFFRNKSLRRVLMSVLLLGASVAMAQPPVLLTQPNPPTAGQAFTATLRIALGHVLLGVSQQPSVEIVGNTIRIPFNTSCPFLCPPNNGTRDYTFSMPALPAGSYNVVFYGTTGDPPPLIAQVPLTVVSGVLQAVSVPALSNVALLLLVLIMLLIAYWRLVSRGSAKMGLG